MKLLLNFVLIGGPENVLSNAGNILFEDFMRSRFPNLFDKRDCGNIERDCSQILILRRWFNLCNDDCRG